jgi:hypothetical protein
MRGLAVVALLLVVLGSALLVTAVRGRSAELKKAVFE